MISTLQPQNQGSQVQKPTAARSTQDAQPASPASSTSAREHKEDATEVARKTEDAKKAAPSSAALNEQKTTQALVASRKPSNSNEEQKMQVDSVSPLANESAQPALQDKVVEEAGRLTRARSRKIRASNN